MRFEFLLFCAVVALGFSLPSVRGEVWNDDTFIDPNVYGLEEDEQAIHIFENNNPAYDHMGRTLLLNDPEEYVPWPLSTTSALL